MDQNGAKISVDFMKKVRGFLRITEENDEIINAEITSLINSCRKDLMRNGITSEKANSEEDSLVESAILLYLKAEFGLDNKNYERYRSSYETLRNELSLTDEYVSEVVDNVG